MIPATLTEPQLTKSERIKQSNGLRRRFKGRRGILVKRMDRSGFTVRPKSHEPTKTTPARKGYTCGDALVYPHGEPSSSAALNKFRVSLPHNVIRYVRPS